MAHKKNFQSNLMGCSMDIRLSESEVEKMVTKHGFIKKKTVDIGEYSYLITFLSP